MKSIQNKSGFCMSNWLAILHATNQHFDARSGIESICAFGFELLEDRSFLRKTLRRINCLVGIRDPTILPKNFEILYSLHLLEELTQSDPTFLDNIAAVKIKRRLSVGPVDFILLRRHEPEYQCTTSDRIVIITFQQMETDIWTEYCNNILSRLGILCTNFRNQRAPRNRFYQLYEMYEALFGHLIPPMTSWQKRLHKLLVGTDNTIQRTYDAKGHLADPSITPSYPWEDLVIDHLIGPRMRLIQAAVSPVDVEGIVLTPPPRSHHEKWKAFLSKDAYEGACKKIRENYFAFHSCAVPTAPSDSYSGTNSIRTKNGKLSNSHINNVLLRIRIGNDYNQRDALEKGRFLEEKGWEAEEGGEYRLVHMAEVYTLQIGREYLNLNIMALGASNASWPEIYERAIGVLLGSAPAQEDNND